MTDMSKSEIDRLGYLTRNCTGKVLPMVKFCHHREHQPGKVFGHIRGQIQVNRTAVEIRTHQTKFNHLRFSLSVLSLKWRSSVCCSKEWILRVRQSYPLLL